MTETFTDPQRFEGTACKASDRRRGGLRGDGAGDAGHGKGCSLKKGHSKRGAQNKVRKTEDTITAGLPDHLTPAI
jgi:hypothetical protein